MNIIKVMTAATRIFEYTDIEEYGIEFSFSKNLKIRLYVDNHIEVHMFNSWYASDFCKHAVYLQNVKIRSMMDRILK